MSALSSSRRTHSKSYPVALRHFRPNKESIDYSSPPHPTVKSKSNINSYLPTAFDTSLLSTEVLTDKTNLSISQPKQKKRVKLNYINPLVTQSISRKPLKSPKIFKLIPAGNSDTSRLTERTCFNQSIRKFSDEEPLSNTFRAPSFCRTGPMKKRTLPKTNETFFKGRTAAWSNSQIPMSTRVTDTTLCGTYAGVNMLDFTSAVLASIDDLGPSNNENIEPNIVKKTFDTAEDFNKRLQSIFRGGNLDQSASSELETSIAEEDPDLDFRVFNAKPLMCQLKN